MRGGKGPVLRGEDTHVSTGGRKGPALRVEGTHLLTRGRCASRVTLKVVKMTPMAKRLCSHPVAL
eukprot:4576094-Karenia_brevis.AAC.1